MLRLCLNIPASRSAHGKMRKCSQSVVTKGCRNPRLHLPESMLFGQNYSHFSKPHQKFQLLAGGGCRVAANGMPWPSHSLLAARLRSVDDRDRAGCIAAAHRGLQEEEVE